LTAAAPQLTIILVTYRPGAPWWMLGAALLSAAPASALDPHRAVTQYSVRTWRGGAGFPQDPTIQAITQTPDGYLWLATMEGLLRFDGVRTTRFFGTQQGLPNNNIWHLFVDERARLWAGTDGGGIFVWQNGVVETFSTTSGLSGNSIRPIVKTRDGAMWIGTSRNGISRYKDGKWTHLTKKDGLAADTVWSMAQAPDGSVWVGAGGVNRCRADKCEVVRTLRDGLPGDGVTALMVTRSGDLWVGMWAGLSRLHEGRWRDWRVTDGLPGGTVRAIHEDRDGNIWIGTTEGLTRFREDGFDTLTKDQGAAGGYVRALFEDKEGTLWVGSVSAGLSALSDGQFLNIGDAEGLPHRNARSVAATHDGGFWVSAGINTGLTRWKDGKGQTVRGLPSEALRSFTVDPADDRSLWIGLEENIVHWRADKGVMKRYDRKDGIPPSAPACLFVEAADHVWVGSLQGLAELRDGVWKTHTTKDGLPSNNVFSVVGARSGGIWVGTSDGIVRRRDDRWLPAPGESPRLSIYALYEDADGILWAGTNGGLWRYGDGKWTVFDLAHGLCSDTVNFLLEDDLGALWTTSPKGLCRVSRAALNTLAHGGAQKVDARLYDRSDGIRETGFAFGNSPKGGKTADGRVFFASNNGIVVVDPRKLHAETAPSATIEALTADNVPVPLGRPITLGPGRPRLEFRFTGLTLVAPEKLRFRYRIDGFDPDWIDAGDQRVANYTNLPPGSYTFRVDAATSDGIWNQTGSPLSFRVKPHVWETWWFRLAAVLALAALGVNAYTLRVRRMRLQAEELERRVQEALQHIQTLKGLLPICASCKKIRDDGGYWNQIETYVSSHSGAEFSHSICPDCLTKLYPEYANARHREGPS
jgi:ligand-binding sensor domain-containing protein